MSNIDLSQIITAEDKAAQAAADRAAAIKALCGSKISAVLPTDTQQNLAMAQAMGTLTAAQEATLVEAEGWKWAMIGECRAAIDEGRDPVWPDAPQSVASLAEAF